MEVIIPFCAGLDVHRSVIVACAMWSVGRRLRKETASFGSTANGLAELAAWLKRHGVTHVAMESTGVYWMPVYAALEEAGGLALTVVNPQHVKAISGRKTDVKDAEWLAQLLRHGLLRNSFVPPKPIRDLRDLTRYRRTLIEAQSSERNRLIKLLEATGVKLAGVVSDVFGVSGRAMLRALIAGEEPPAAMAKLARGRLRKKDAQLTEALAGRLEPHHRDLLAMQLARVDGAEADIAALDRQIAERLAPYQDKVALLITIPGVDWVTAAIIVAETGLDMSVFPSAKHLAAWAGVCPGNNESGGKRKPAGTRKGNPYLKTALANAAIGASRRRGSYLKAKYYKLKVRRGGGRAALAIAHKLLVYVFHILSNGTPYADLGEAYLDKRNHDRSKQNHVRHLESLGYTVTLHREAAAEPA